MAIHIVCVGAVYIDTILSIPKFPIEDEKLRATSHARRRGGNCANTLEVLSQLIPTTSLVTQLHLLTVLPKRDSPATKFICDSLPGVQTNACLYREEQDEAASSYILQNAQNQSRTIVSYNPLGEMEHSEFGSCVMRLLLEAGGLNSLMHGWFHFEGRVPETTLQGVQLLKSMSSARGFRVSVECEKPERVGMAKVAEIADMVFYSKIWVQGHGFDDPHAFLESQISSMMDQAILCCTWGEKGAVAVKKRQDGNEWARVPAWKPTDGCHSQVVDTIGAGDTFIAGMLFALTHHEHDWNLEQKLMLANELAGRKVLQHGFSNLVDKK
ncbi:Ribokinase-like protein [Periconia macrospinosa]|uniref:Ribokinase-like protein n=1 Tax=Periconia macrospinosa TaxID=97972 RepID=A0A2V1D6Z0_9PLEO|nr:Ribokinase-like protein [Periconia macrospinosa]